jgi:ribonuclease H2 subunit A
MIELGIGYNTAVLDPEMLSGSMLRLCVPLCTAPLRLRDRNKYNLNDISHDTAVGLVRGLIKKGLKVKEVYVDTVGPPEKYQRKLEGLFSGAKITVSKKADSLFPIVSAASIAAKVIRDHRLKTWTFKERNLTAVSTNFGSGYPAGTR